MKRRNFLTKGAITIGASLLPKLEAFSVPNHQVTAKSSQYYYINWAAYDLLSDDKPLTEKIALDQLEVLKQLKSKGFQCDGYIMDAFWYEPQSRYRIWNKAGFPNGPDKWLAACKSAGLKPGIWLSTNVATINGNQIISIPDPIWKTSLNRAGTAYCLFDGGYFPDFMEAMQELYNAGLRIFKFDFADLKAATPAMERKYLLRDIVRLNEEVLYKAFKAFKLKNPGTEFLAYNGFGGDFTNTSRPIFKVVDEKWLDIFDALYCGDPRPSDVPHLNIWKSKDLYSCHQVRQYYENGIPLDRIDNTAFMIGNTGTCYLRGKEGWLRMWIVSLARGAGIQTFYGDLTLLTTSEQQLMADVQKLFVPYRQNVKLIGDVPGTGKIHGYELSGPNGKMMLIINPAQTSEVYKVPGNWNVIYSDYKLADQINNSVELAPEHLIWIAESKIPKLKIESPVSPFANKGVSFQISPKLVNGLGTVTVKINQPAKGLRCWFNLIKPDGTALRISGGAPPNGKLMTELLNIKIQDAKGEELKLETTYDKAIWSGLSYMFVCSNLPIAAGEYTVKVSVISPDPNFTVKAHLVLNA